MSLGIDLTLRLRVVSEATEWAHHSGPPALQVYFTDREGYIADSAELPLAELARALKPFLT
jgi:hypothetical protein